MTVIEETEKLALEEVEVQLLTEGIYRHYGFDFRDYSLPSLRRRIWKRVYAEGLSTISGLQEKVLHDAQCMERLLLDLSINTTAMFRDPSFYAAFRQKVVPLLRTYPFARIWHAGCSTGEEVYSMAILLQEDGRAQGRLGVVGPAAGRAARAIPAAICARTYSTQRSNSLRNSS